MKPLTDKILVLGVDGMDPSLSKKFLNQGLMPNLQKFIQAGSCRDDLTLLGAMPTVTPPMWTTLATGAYPYTHGITGFFNQHPTKLDTTIYALDSRLCKAEQLWNVFAEAGKKTLVWHWPGSSWPPTSDSPNLHVVDGTQPNTMELGTALADWEKICIASTDFNELKFVAHDAVENTGAGCVMNDLDDVVADNTTVAAPNKKMTGTEARKMSSNGAKEFTFLVLNEDETETNLLSGSNSDMIYSPITEAHNWANAPEDAKEFTLLTSAGYVRRPCLLLKNEDGIYDTLEIYKSKKSTAPLFTIMAGEYKRDYVDEVFAHGHNTNEKTLCSRSVTVLELAEDGSKIRFWIGNAVDLNKDSVWHPRALRKEVYDICGAAPLVPQCSGKLHENVSKLLLPGWDAYCDWQAECLNYLLDRKDYSVVFSHLHNVDALGHKFWHYAKYREEWNNEPEFYQEAMAYIYKQTDNYIGKFLHYLDEGWTIFIVSDHGLISEENQPPILCEMCVTIPVMKELGFTVLKKDEYGNELREIDWTQTKALATRGGQIYINLEGRDANGIVKPEEKYALEDEIISALYNYRDHKTGKRAVALALRNKDAVILGEGGPECGDIIFFMEEGFNIIHMDSLPTQRGYYDTSVSPIFVAAGNGIKENYTTERIIRQVDVAPTLAVLGGVRMPAQAEGAIIHQILKTDY